jgi:hypothetical protein
MIKSVAIHNVPLSAAILLVEAAGFKIVLDGDPRNDDGGWSDDTTHYG